MVQIKKKYLRGIEHCWDRISLKILCCKYHYMSGLKKKKDSLLEKYRLKFLSFSEHFITHCIKEYIIMEY